MRNGMSHSEAGKLGGAKGGEARVRLHVTMKDEYEANPRLCKNCQEPISYERRNRSFCNSSCSATYNNKARKAKRYCLSCGALLKNRHARKYCCSDCQWQYTHSEYIRRWLSGKEDGITSGGLEVSTHIRRYVMEEQKGACSICSNTTWMGKPIPLILDHIDGNGLNNKPENLRMVCGNCDMQLPTFAGRNKGNGRKIRREMRRQGKWKS